MNQELMKKVAELEEKLRVQTERVRALEQRLRDVASYAARDLPTR
jgi:hypothetical protein